MAEENNYIFKEEKSELKRLYWLSKEYPVTPEQVDILFRFTKNVFRTEDFCMLLEEGETWETILKMIKEDYGG